MKTPYSNFSISERIKRIMNDESFLSFCKKQIGRQYFIDMLPVVERVASIDISRIDYDRSLIENVNLFNIDDISEDVMGFYTDIDALDEYGISLTKRLKENIKYVKYDSDKKARSHCKSEIDKNGNEIREIYVNVEGRIGDSETAIHEFCHSFSEVFKDFALQRDYRVDEIPSVICDNLSSLYMQNKYPEYKESFIENDKFRQILNVRKARECLLDALIIKVVCKEEILDNAMKIYGDLFKDNRRMLINKLEEIETFSFSPLFEAKYLIPQAIALVMKERFKENPELVAKQLKNLIKENHLMTQEDAIEYLSLVSKEELINNYVSNFESRMIELDREKENIRKKTSTRK